MAASSIQQTHPAAYPVFPDPFENTVLKTWSLQGKYFRIVRLGNKLETELIFPFGEHIRTPIEIPPDRSMEDAISHLLSLEPAEDANGSIYLNKPKQWIEPPRAHEPGRPGTFKSLLDQETFVDDNCWAITLVDTFRTRLDPKTWAGHAALIIEGVSNGEFFLKKAHLVSGFQGAGEVRLTRIPSADFRVDGITHKSASWTVSPVAAQYMLDHIQEEESQIRAGRLMIKLDPTARGENPSTKNCFLWARDTLQWAGITLYRGNGSIASRAPLFYAPKDIISTTSVHSIFSKASVAVRVESPTGKLHTYVDITETLANYLGAVSWKIAKAPGKGFDIPADATAILEESKPTIAFRAPVILSVKIAGKPDLKMVDVTEKVKSLVAKELGLEPAFCAIL